MTSALVTPIEEPLEEQAPEPTPERRRGGWFVRITILIVVAHLVVADGGRSRHVVPS